LFGTKKKPAGENSRLLVKKKHVFSVLEPRRIMPAGENSRLLVKKKHVFLVFGAAEWSEVPGAGVSDIAVFEPATSGSLTLKI